MWRERKECQSRERSGQQSDHRTELRLVTTAAQGLGDGAGGDLCGEVCWNLQLRLVLDGAVDARLYICRSAEIAEA